MHGESTLLLLLQATAVYAGSHSLWALATFIYGQTQFPEFSVVVMLDDVQVQYYDNRQQVIARRQQNSGNEEDSANLDNIVADLYHSMKRRSQLLMLRFNYSEGVHVYQRMAGCELNEDKPSPIIEWSAFDGTEAASYIRLNYTLNPQWPELMWSELKFAAYKYIYEPFCINMLRQHLKKDKNIVMRKERPRVRFIQKADRDTGGVRVSCVATGFYPRHIHLTMLRESRPIPDQELTVGEVLPNGDGTYQLRRDLSVSVEELREKHRYTCTVAHLSLDNKLDVSWEPRDDPLIVVIPVAVVLAGVLISSITAFVTCRRRHRGSQTSLQPVYTAAPGAEDSAVTLNPS